MPNSSDEALRLDNQLCFGLYAASRKVIQLYYPLLDRLGITYTQYITLLVLWEQNRLTVKELCRTLMLDTGTLTPLLKKLEKKGLVTRTRSLQDERSVIIEITLKGVALKKDALQFLPTLLCAVDLGPRQLTELHDLVNKLLLSLGKGIGVDAIHTAETAIE